MQTRSYTQEEPTPRPYVDMLDGNRVWIDEGTEHEGEYLCSGSQSHKSAIFDAGTQRLQENGRPIPFAMDCYAIEGYCPHCAATANLPEGDANGETPQWFGRQKARQPGLFEPKSAAEQQLLSSRGTGSNMSAANYRFFKTPDPADLRRIEQAEALWEQVKDQLVWPKGQAIPYGYNTRVGNDLWVHGYHDWAELFAIRQLLCLSEITTAIHSLPHWMNAGDQGQRILVQEAFSCALMQALRNNNMDCLYSYHGSKIEPLFLGHHFKPRPMWCENAVWGGRIGRGTFIACCMDGKQSSDGFVAEGDNADESDGESSCGQLLAGLMFRYYPYDRCVVPLVINSDFIRLNTDREITTFLRRLSAALCDAKNVDFELAAKPVFISKRKKWFPNDGLGQLRCCSLDNRGETQAFIQNAHQAAIVCGDASSLRFIPDGLVDLVITDPPFGDNVNYSELSDFFYAWLALILKGRYRDARGKDLFDHWEDEIMPKERAERDGFGFTEDPSLSPGFVRRRRLVQTPKQAEMIESRSSRQTKTARDYNDALRAAFAEAHRKLKPNGLMAFTFHHNDVRAWWAVVAAVLECVPPGMEGFHLEAVYPIVGETETPTHHSGRQNATFDILHVCRKRTALPTPIKWAVFRRRVREAVRTKRAELLSIPAYNPQEGGYVSRNDLRMILLGVGFQLYSEHYGQVEFPPGFLRQAQAAPRGRRGKRTIAEAAQLLFDDARQDSRCESDPADDPAARNLREVTYAIDEILDEIEHEDANPLPPELQSLAGEVDRISRYYFKHLLPEHGRTIKFDDLKQLEYRTGVAVTDLTNADVLTTRHRNREYEIKRPGERYTRLRKRLLEGHPPLGILDRAHFLIGAIDDAAWAERNQVDPRRIDEFLVEGKPLDEAWADQTEQLVAAVRMISAHVSDEETKTACSRALKWLAPATGLFAAPAKTPAAEGKG